MQSGSPLVKNTLLYLFNFLLLIRLKSRILHIISSVFLISTLLFAQVAVNFFHRNHDVHENKSITAPLKDGAAGVQKHDEHCKVCSVDFFNHAFVGNDLILTDHSFSSIYKKQIIDLKSHAFVSFSQGRAPPLS